MLDRAAIARVLPLARLMAGGLLHDELERTVERLAARWDALGATAVDR